MTEETFNIYGWLRPGDGLNTADEILLDYLALEWLSTMNELSYIKKTWTSGTEQMNEIYITQITK